MKKMILIAATLLLPLSSFAAIELKAGSSIVINGEVITCQAPEDDYQAAPCAIRQDSIYYRVYAGTTIVDSYTSFNQALKAVKDLKEAGLCR